MTTTSAVTSLENRLKQIISNIRNLPTPPIVFEQIQKVLNNPETSVADVAAILSEDPAMSVKVLRLTNSAFYGLSREIDSVNHAVMIIGLEAVKNLVLSASVLSMFKSSKDNKDYHERFWRHSLASALAARVIARDFKGGKAFNPDPAFSTGLIHDITWKLPDRLADAIGYHHTPGMENNSDDFAYLINLADYVAHNGHPAEVDGLTRAKIDPGTMKFFNIEEEYVEQLKSRLIEEYMKAETFMKIAGIN